MSLHASMCLYYGIYNQSEAILLEPALLGISSDLTKTEEPMFQLVPFGIA